MVLIKKTNYLYTISLTDRELAALRAGTYTSVEITTPDGSVTVDPSHLGPPQKKFKRNIDSNGYATIVCFWVCSF